MDSDIENKNKFYRINNSKVHLWMNSKSNVILKGNYQIEILKGKAKILGYKFQKGKKYFINCNSIFLSSNQHALEEKIEIKDFPYLKSDITMIKDLSSIIEISADQEKSIRKLIDSNKGQTTQYKKLIPKIELFRNLNTSDNEKSKYFLIFGSNYFKGNQATRTLINKFLNYKNVVTVIDADLESKIIGLKGSILKYNISNPILTDKYLIEVHQIEKSFFINCRNHNDSFKQIIESVRLLKENNLSSIIIVNTNIILDLIGLKIVEELEAIFNFNSLFYLNFTSNPLMNKIASLLKLNAIEDIPEKYENLIKKAIEIQFDSISQEKNKNLFEYKFLYKNVCVIPFNLLYFKCSEIKFKINKIDLLRIYNHRHIIICKLISNNKLLKFEDITCLIDSNPEESKEIITFGIILEIDYNYGVEIMSFNLLELRNPFYIVINEAIESTLTVEENLNLDRKNKFCLYPKEFYDIIKRKKKKI